MSIADGQDVIDRASDAQAASYRKLDSIRLAASGKKGKK
jgi:hypothetical protein